MTQTYTGKLISIEGIDGSGKSTLARALHNTLEQQGFSSLLTKEFGATPLGSQLRTILHHRTASISPQAEFLIVAADRAQHFTEVVIPSLQKGMFVISDRMNHSSMAYQGFGRGLDLNLISTVNAWAMQGIRQDLIFFVDVDIQTALSRIAARNEKLTAFEQEKSDFWHKVQEGYRSIMLQDDRIVKLDGRLSPDELLAAAIIHLKKRNIIP